MGVDENGLKRGRCAKLNCFCHCYSGKKATSKKEKKERGKYFCRECLHTPIDHVVASEGLTDDLPNPSLPEISMVDKYASKPMKQADQYIPAIQKSAPVQNSSSYSNSSVGTARSVNAPNPHSNIVNETNNYNQSPRELQNYTNAIDDQFGRLTETVRVGSTMNPNSNLNSNLGGGQTRGNSNNRGGAGVPRGVNTITNYGGVSGRGDGHGNGNGNGNGSGNRGYGHGSHISGRGAHGNGNGNGNRATGTGTGGRNSPQRAQPSKSPFGSGFAPRAPSMAPSALGVQDRGNYDDSHIRECDKVTRLGRNVGLVGPDKYILSHMDAKYYESSKMPPSTATGFTSPSRGRPVQSGTGNRGGNMRGGNVRGNNVRGVSGNTRGSGNGPRNASPRNASPRNYSPTGRALSPTGTSGSSGFGGPRSGIPGTGGMGGGYSGGGNTSGGYSSGGGYPGQRESNLTPATKEETTDSCCICNQEIYGSYMVLGSYTYHKHCAKCNDCGQNVFRSPFFQVPKSRFLACDTCFERKHCRKCNKCGRAVISDGVKALDATWHRNCLTCVVCNITLQSNTQWFSIEGRPYCDRCAQ